MIWQLTSVMLIKNLVLSGLALLAMRSLVKRQSFSRAPLALVVVLTLSFLILSLTAIIVWPFFPMSDHELIRAHAVLVDLLLLAAALRSRGIVRFLVVAVLVTLVGFELFWGFCPGFGS